LVHIVDLYAKTVIAVLGFIAPTVTLLLPILGGKISVIRAGIIDKERVTEQIRNGIKDQYKASLDQMPEGPLKKQFKESVDKDCEKSTKDFDKSIKKLKRNLRILTLKMQIKHIFISLLLSIGLIAAYYVSKYHVYGVTFNQHTTLLYRTLSLSISFIFFSYALWRLWTLVCIVVEHKTEEAALNTTIKADGGTTTNPEEN